MQKLPSEKILFHRVTSLFALAVIAASAAYVFWNLMLPRKDFYNELWAPAYLLVHGESPYHTAPLNPNLPAAWLPMVIGFFFPLGWLGEDSALVFWYLFNILEICIIVYLVQDKLKLHNTVALALMAFFFPLTLNHINLGQFSITAMLAWMLAIRRYEGDSPKQSPARWGDASLSLAMTSILIALALSKPHLGLPALLGFSYYHYAARGGLKAMFSLWLRIGVAASILCLPLFVAYPKWIPDMIAAMKANPSWSYPSLFVLYHRFIPALKYPLWILTVLSALAFNFWLWKKLPAQNALYWSLALAPFVTHYVGSWDFVLVLPLFTFTYVNVNWKRKIFLWVAYLIAWGLMARIQMMVPSHNHYFWWIPLWFIGAAAFVTFFRKSDNPLWK